MEDLIKSCPFCDIASHDSHDRMIDSNEHAFLIHDGYPITQGHSLVIPKRHVGSFFELNEQERQAMFDLLTLAKKHLDKTFRPDSYNIGINDGPAAGQTIAHCHMHLIPRYDESGKDPRGGIRWLVPEKADYWSDRT